MKVSNALSINLSVCVYLIALVLVTLKGSFCNVSDEIPFGDLTQVWKFTAHLEEQVLGFAA